jgi:hypothetical protein
MKKKMFTQDLNMQWIAAKLVTCLLTDEQKQNRISVCVRPTGKLNKFTVSFKGCRGY